jgi:hypothetical protein
MYSIAVCLAKHFLHLLRVIRRSSLGPSTMIPTGNSLAHIAEAACGRLQINTEAVAAACGATGGGRAPLALWPWVR